MSSSTVRGGGDQRGHVGALQKGLQILDLYSAQQPELSIGHMAKVLDIHKSSASRLAATLATAGYLQQASAPGVYRLGQRIAALGQLAGARSELTDIVMPHLANLVQATGETGHLAVLRGADTSTLGVVDGWHTVRMHSFVGKQSPAYVSSMGKALLAGFEPDALHALLAGETFLPRTERTIASLPALEANLADLRRTGFGFDDEELEVGLRCISAPIFAPDGTVDASISISGPTQRIDLPHAQALAEHVRWHAWLASLARGATHAPEGWATPPSEPPAPLALP